MNSKSNKVKQIVLAMSDGKTFTKDDLAYQAGVSIGCAYLAIKEMQAARLVVMDHKDGQAMHYSKTSEAASDGAAATAAKGILSLTVEERFDYISSITDMVINGISPSALITGVAGIGKTFLVKKCFDDAGQKEGIDFHFVKGHSTAMGLYRYLYEHRDATCVFDDCDFKGDDIAINILKSALDSYDVRKISWQSERMPEDLEKEFEFKGSIIFITNKDASEIDEAVKSRTFVINLQMSRKEIVEYMREIADDIEPQIDLGLKLEVIDYLDEVRDHFEQFNLRTLIKATRVRRGINGPNQDWKKAVLVMV